MTDFLAPSRIIAILVVFMVLFFSAMTCRHCLIPKKTSVETKSEKSGRMVEIEDGRTSYYVPYVILRDTTTGAEYLSFRNGGVIKLEKKD